MRLPALAAYVRTPRELRSVWLLKPFELRDEASLRTLRRQVGGGGEGAHIEVVPEGRTEPSGAVLWFHGGGYVVGSGYAHTDHVTDLAHDLGAVAVAVDYRLAPEHPFPAALEDGYAVLADVVRRADELGVDPDRIAVAGASAGGGLAAALCQLVRDRGEYRIRFQALRYPMLDDRTEPATRRHFVWTPRSNRTAWDYYLGGSRAADGTPPPYAVPSRASDLAGLPPAWIGIGDADLFLEESRAYAERLSAAGVPVDLTVVPGMYHGADGVRPGAPSVVEFLAAEREALRRALAPLTEE
ncbi:alpha/beta hydrolase [Nocardioides sp. YIM 152588]|uniref:alpha/beta hydrolase n=1 Tax=Nocardioides sp. YIM 152588 TaxID=3158259 RepID=UPI0032E451C9